MSLLGQSALLCIQRGVQKHVDCLPALLLCTLAAAAGTLAEVASQHELRPALVKVTLLIAPILPWRWVVTAELCIAWHDKIGVLV
jgi:hypothetical protein